MAGASDRSKLAAKNIALSVVLKFVSILTSFLIVPLTINYIDATQYGIWMTISSIVAWAGFFDLGLSNGFKNKFAEARAKNDDVKAQEYVSTTYILMTAIMTIVLFFFLLGNNFINWPQIINVSEKYRVVLHDVFAVLCLFFCMNMVVNTFAKLLEADQHPSIAALISGIGQLLSLVVIFLLVKISEGNLLNLAIFYSGIPFFTMLAASVLMFTFSHYRQFRPTFSSFRKELIKNIMGIGLKFFAIYLCLIIVFQLMNIVLSREVGPLAVTQYNIASRYFNVAYMFAMIVVTPMWAAFTDAYTKRDFSWMNSTVKKFEKAILFSIGILTLMCTVSPFIYKIWIGDNVQVSLILSAATAVLILSQIAGAVYMSLLNGIGAVSIQFLIYLLFAIVAFPLMTLCCREFGVVGITFVPTAVYFFQAIIGRIQIWKIINKTATGLWLK